MDNDAPPSAGAHQSDVCYATHELQAGHAGYWDLVYILYPEFVDVLGLQAVHDLLPSWQGIEANLEVRGGLTQAIAL